MSFFRRQFSRRKENDRGKEDGNENDIPGIETTPTQGISGSGSGSGVLEPNPYAKYGLKSPPRGVAAVAMEKAEKHIKKDGFGKYLKTYRNDESKTKPDSMKARGLVFLYGRGFLANTPQDHRKWKIQTILDNPEAMKRLNLLLETEDGDRDITESNKELYKRLCLALHRYFRQEGAFGVDTSKYFFRFQKQGNCFMHASCVHMAYLLQRLNVEGGSPVDLSKFVRRTFTDEELYSYIAKDEGGKPQEFSQRMLEPLMKGKPQFDAFSSLSVNEKGFDLEGIIRKHGPGIVTGFNCNKHFKHEKWKENEKKIGYVQFQGRHHKRGNFVELPGGGNEEEYCQTIEVTLNEYITAHKTNDSEVTKVLFPSGSTPDKTTDSSKQDCADGGRKEECHSMLLLGGRLVNNKLFLLFQNWWPTMQLVEVDAEYFAAAEASLFFLNHKKEYFKTNEYGQVDLGAMFYSLNSSLVADAYGLDRADYNRGDGCFSYGQLDR